MLARPELDAASKGLLEMAEYIKEHGWCQNTPEDEEGHVCIIGAMIRTSSEHWLTAKPRLLKAIGIGPEWFDPISWNNAPGRTKEEVIDKLIEAAYFGQIKE